MLKLVQQLALTVHNCAVGYFEWSVTQDLTISIFTDSARVTVLCLVRHRSYE